MTTLIVKWK